jgi:hypothetical protein
MPIRPRSTRGSAIGSFGRLAARQSEKPVHRRFASDGSAAWRGPPNSRARPGIGCRKEVSRVAVRPAHNNASLCPGSPRSNPDWSTPISPYQWVCDGIRECSPRRRRSRSREARRQRSAGPKRRGANKGASAVVCAPKVKKMLTAAGIGEVCWIGRARGGACR